MTYAKGGAVLALGVLGLLIVSPLRTALESRMWLHMGLQLPLIFCCGVAMVAPWSQFIARITAPWNSLGLVGLIFVSLTGLVWMIPRSLDAAVAYLSIDALKFLSVWLAGSFALPSWSLAPTVVRGFIVGNAVWMACFVGVLLLDTELRVCNAYLLGDQKTTGQIIIGIALLGGGLWLISVVRSSMQKAVV